MKLYTWMLLTLAVVALAVVGCNKKSSVDTAPLESSFKTAEPATQTTANKAVTSIKAGNYAEALTELKTLASNTKLTPEQQQAIKDAMAQVQQSMSDQASKMAGDASKSLDDMKKSLPK